MYVLKKPGHVDDWKIRIIKNTVFIIGKWFFDVNGNGNGFGFKWCKSGRSKLNGF